MIEYVFYSNLKEEEIEYKISTLPELSLFEVSTRGNFCGDIIRIGFVLVILQMHFLVVIDDY